MAPESDSSSPDRTVLPPADPSFRGEIEVALKDSEAAFPEPVRAPTGAPNVLLILGDDIGYGHMGAFGGPASTPVFDRLAGQGLIFTNFHTTPDRRDPWLRIGPEDVMTLPLAGQPGRGSVAVLRNQRVRIVDGRVQGGYTDRYELICLGCGDHSCLYCSKVPPRLPCPRGPCPLDAGLAAYDQCLGLSTARGRS